MSADTSLIPAVVKVLDLDASPERVWDAITGAELYTLEGHSNSVNSITWSPDGAMLASFDINGDMWVWNTASGDKLYKYEQEVGVFALLNSVAWSPDGTLLALGVDDNMIHVLGISTD